MKTIEEWKKIKHVSDCVFEGMKAFKRWRTGKSVTEKDFTDAVDAFLKAPVDGRPLVEKAEEAKG